MKRPSMREDDRYTVGIRDEGTTRMEGNRFIGYELLMNHWPQKESGEGKNHGIYTVSAIKDKLGIWGWKKLRIEGYNVGNSWWSS